MARPSAIILTAATLLFSASARAQAPIPQHSTVVSFQPLSAMVTLYAAEIEQRVSPTLTVGAGGSYFNYGGDDFSYKSGDLKLRYYPEGHALSGFAFGVQGGYTSVTETISSQALGGGKEERQGGGGTAGVSLDYNWLLGASRSFYLGLGIGAKKLFIDSERFSDPTLAYPTARISIGHAF